MGRLTRTQKPIKKELKLETTLFNRAISWLLTIPKLSTGLKKLNTAFTDLKDAQKNRLLLDTIGSSFNREEKIELGKQLLQVDKTNQVFLHLLKDFRLNRKRTYQFIDSLYPSNQDHRYQLLNKMKNSLRITHSLRGKISLAMNVYFDRAMRKLFFLKDRASLNSRTRETLTLGSLMGMIVGIGTILGTPISFYLKTEKAKTIAAFILAPIIVTSSICGTAIVCSLAANKNITQEMSDTTSTPFKTKIHHFLTSI